MGKNASAAEVEKEVVNGFEQEWSIALKAARQKDLVAENLYGQWNIDGTAIPADFSVEFNEDGTVVASCNFKGKFKVKDGYLHVDPNLSKLVSPPKVPVKIENGNLLLADPTTGEYLFSLKSSLKK